MSQYTEYLNFQAAQLSPLDDDYEEQLKKTAEKFRDFGTALTEFLKEHGYSGPADNVQEKAAYLREQYRLRRIEDVPRDFRKWFSPGMRLKRKTVFPLLFALDLDLEQSKDFFRRVLLDRGFDCHSAEEAIYYFCVKNGLSYAEGKQAAEQLPPPEKTAEQQEVLYTDTIAEYLDNAENLSQVVSYISENRSDFSYNHATAGRFIKKLWSDISGEQGLAAAEGRLIRSAQANSPETGTEDLPVTADSDTSTWTIYTQILGLDHYTARKYASTRSLAPVFTDNVLLPLRAGDCFPGRQSIEGILRGRKGENETFRKVLILLVFYTFWAKRSVGNENLLIRAEAEDWERCLDHMNQYLLHAGYPELYAGNPYDWIFLGSLHDEDPLATFRHYIGEVFAVDSEKNAVENETVTPSLSVPR